MKHLLSIFAILIGFHSFTFGQNLYEQVEAHRKTNGNTSPYSVFQKKSPNFNSDNFLNSSQVTTLQLEEKALRQALSQKPQFVSLLLPTLDDTLQLDLFAVNLFSPDFKVKALSNFGETEILMPEGFFYRGVVHNDPASIAAISFINGEASGIIADSTGTRLIGKTNNSSTNDYFLYYESNLKGKPDFRCDANDLTDQIERAQNDPEAACSSGIGIYFEADKSMFDNFGGSDGTRNYIVSLFNQISTMYANENINVLIAAISIWTTADPYQTATNTSTALSLFKNRWNGMGNNFPGQLAHLLSRRSLGGGIAYVNVLCGARTYAYAVSALNGFYNNYPAYSWDVMVVTHELGHNFGSPHTQSCTWPGGAIDNCYTTEEGCPRGPAPTNGGTVMSYCHLTSYGINLANGFGPLPGNLIRQRYAAASSCYSIPSSTVPTNLTATQIQGTKATLNWSQINNVTSFTIQYRLQSSSGAWTEISFAAYGHILTGLTPNTAYSWRVKSECSNYSAIAGFSTNNNIPYCEPNTDCSDNDGLKSLTINSVQLSNNSGCSPGGYRFFDSAPLLQLTSGISYPFTATLLSTTWPEHVRIWIDYNKNSIFENNEIVYSTTSTVVGSISSNMAIAANIQSTITTRMRVRVKYDAIINDACEIYTYGETEDYPVQILPANTNCESVASGSWSSTATWSCGRIPLATDVVIIKPGHTITLNDEGKAKSLEFQANAKLQYQAGGHLKLNY